MKARTLIVTTGAVAALVAGTVQPAGAKVASTWACAGSGANAHEFGYVGSGWSYPAARRVLVVGNGTRAPYYAFVRSSCGGQKAAPRLVHHTRMAAPPTTLVPGTGMPVSADAARSEG